MTDRTSKILEYDKIIEILKGYACSEMARNVISEMTPFDDVRICMDALAETNEAVTLIFHLSFLWQ